MMQTPAPAGTTQLLERAAELSLLRELLAAVQRTGTGRMLLVGGEAGVGKTTLLRRFSAERPASTCVTWGSCDALFTPAPMAPLLDIAEALGGELGEALGASATAHDAVGALSRQLREQPGGVLVLEDLHWADEATLDVLRLLARRIESVPALIVATYRNDQLEPGHPLRLVLGEFASADAVRRTGLSPLSRAAVGTLAEPYPVDVDELYAKTSGNPFFVLEVLAGDEGAIPDTVRDAVLARAARLSRPARALLESVAILTPPADVWLLESLAAQAIEGLDEALASGMLVPGPATVSFRHELARLAIEDSISPHRLLVLHRRALLALGHPPSGTLDLDRLAHHAEAAGDADAVHQFAPLAARRAAALGAHREAAAQYARALRFGDRIPAGQRAALLERRAAECYVTDQYDEGIAALEGALAIWRSEGDQLREGSVLPRLSNFLWCPGRTQEAEARSREAVALLESRPPGRELALAYSSLAEIYYNGWRFPLAQEHGSAALSLATELGDERTMVNAFCITANVEFQLGERPDLDAVIERAAELGHQSEIGGVYSHISGAAMNQRRYDLAAPYISTGLEYCIDRGLELYRLYLLAHQARMLLDLGQWSEAATAAQGVLAIRRTSTTPRILALVVLALVRARRGDPGRWPLLDEAWELAAGTGELPRLGPVAAAKAEVAWLDGDVEGVASATGDVLPLALQRQAGFVIGDLASWRRRAGLAFSVVGAAPPYQLEPAQESASWDVLSCPYEAALALADADDNDLLLEALERLQRLGAKPAAIVTARLRDRGAPKVPRGPRPSTQANAANLTARELEVLTLLSDGLRNADIAGRLVISRRTVDHHVSRILGKLDASTRSEAGAEARRLGIIPVPRS